MPDGGRTRCCVVLPLGSRAQHSNDDHSCPHSPLGLVSHTGHRERDKESKCRRDRRGGKRGRGEKKG